MRCLNIIAFMPFVWCASPVHAGLFSATDPLPFGFDEKGSVQAVPFNEFKLLMVDWITVQTPGGEKLRSALEAQIRDFKKKDASRLTPEELSTYAACLIRLQKLDDALNLLLTASRNRMQNGFFVQSELAHLHYLRGEYREAFESQYSALRDFPAPTHFGSATPAQLAWLLKIEREYLLPLYKSRRDESKQKGGSVSDTLDDLFPYHNPREKENIVEPVDWRYYSQGEINYFEKQKIPADAIASVQRLMLQNPSDTRLYWLLGEVYNALGEGDTAQRIFDECVDVPRNYTSSLLMEHRQRLHAVKANREEVRKTEEEVKKTADKGTMKIVLIGIGGVLALFFVLQIRSFFRRMMR